MPLNLYRRHFRKPGKCLAGHAPDTRTYEPDERRRRAKKCGCPIYADGTLGGKFRRKNTRQIEWDEAKRVAAGWEAAGAWVETDPTIRVPAIAVESALHVSP